MSRSRKKTPVIKDHTKGEKRKANKKVRKSDEIGSGGSFKKTYESYNISDYRFFKEGDPKFTRK